MDPAAVRSFDIRGLVGVDLHPEDATALGGAYASLARERGLFRFAVGRDGRLSSPQFEAALVEGLVAGGLEVTRIGLGPTPMLTFAVRTLGLDGGIMVTASHNPPGDNGFKLLMGAERIHGSALRSLVARPPLGVPGGRVIEHAVLDDYVAMLAKAAEGIRPLKVAWDCGNGATGEVVSALVSRLPGEHIVLFSEIDGRFPGHHPDPAVGANLRDLQRAVVENGCDLGLAFDGAGAVVWADQLLLLLASDVLRDHPGAAIAADVKSSRVLFDGVAALGGRPVMVPSGYVLVREAMRREGARLAGELSGHVFYAELWDGADDALFAATRVLRALTRSNASLADFRAGLPRTVITPEFRIPCQDDRKAAVVREVGERLAAEGVEVDRADGLRISSPEGWWLLRASGTEPKITCRCEANDEAGLERLMQQLRHELRISGVELD